MKKLMFLLVFCTLSISGAWAQKTFKGKVIGPDRLGLPGVNVVEKANPVNGTATDIDGNWTLTVPNGNAILELTAIGMKPIEIAAKDAANLKMVADSQILEEVVVTAFGSAKKSSLTGSIASVDNKKLAKTQTSDVAKALEGAVSGVVVSNSTGQPGAKSSIRIRGIGSINASSDPLIILDGAPYSGDLNSINNNDIESVSVLKDAASAALYGARGANGVIIITSKSGKKGKLAVKLDAKVGLNLRGVAEYDIMDSPKEYYETMWEALYNKALFNDKLPDEEARKYASSNADEGIYGVLGYNIYDVANDAIVLPNGKLNPAAKLKYSDAGNYNDWDGELFDPQIRQEYNLSVSKKTEKGNYYFSLGYLNDDGYNKNSFFERYSTRFSYDGEILPWLNISSSSMFSRTESNWTSSGSSYSNPFQWTRQIAPIYPIYMHDGEGKLILDKNKKPLYDFGEKVADVNGGRAYGANTNPLATQEKDIKLNTDYYLAETAQLKATITEGLTFSTNASVYGNWYEYSFFLTPVGGSGKTYNGIATKYRYNTTSLNINQLLRYEKRFDDYNFSVLLGHESYDKKTTYLSGEKSNFVDPENPEWNNAAKVSYLNSSNRTYNLEGYFGQITGGYLDKYYFSASLRRDGSSVFHPDHRWGTFWSVGGSWRIDKENFMTDLNWLDILKLKASYGVQGNDYLYLPNTNNKRSWTPYRTLYSITTDGKNPGLKAKYKGREEVTWEENANFNIGLETSVLKGLLNLEFDFFTRKTNNLLFNLPVPSSTGFSTEPWNIGNMKNTGVEFTLKARPISNENVTWNISINGLHYKNEVLSLPDKFKKDGITRGSQRITEGGSIYDFYLVKWAGVNPETGDAQYWVKNKDTKKFEIVQSEDYDANSKQYAGSSIPDLQGGFSTDLSVYGFDLALQFSYQLGGDMLDSQYGGLMHAGSAGNNWHKDIKDRWTPENKNSSIPRLEYNNQKLTQSSDRFMTDASYLSLRSISLGYTLPKNWLSKYKIEGLRLYLAADNVFLLSKRKGLDPRVSLSGLNNKARYSPIRTVSAGFILTL